MIMRTLCSLFGVLTLMAGIALADNNVQSIDSDTQRMADMKEKIDDAMDRPDDGKLATQYSKLGNLGQLLGSFKPYMQVIKGVRAEHENDWNNNCKDKSRADIDPLYISDHMKFCEALNRWLVQYKALEDSVIKAEKNTDSLNKKVTSQMVHYHTPPTQIFKK